MGLQIGYRLGADADVIRATAALEDALGVTAPQPPLDPDNATRGARTQNVSSRP